MKATFSSTIVVYMFVTITSLVNFASTVGCNMPVLKKPTLCTEKTTAAAQPKKAKMPVRNPLQMMSSKFF